LTTPAGIGLGSNVGDREGHLREGVAQLQSLGRVIRISSLYETAPVGGPEQGWYLNAVVTLSTELDPRSLLRGLHEIEDLAGRIRKVRWGPRTLDLDLLVYDAITIRTTDLTIPHPRAHERAFVLVPLAEVWAEADLGIGTAGDLAARIDRADVVLVARDWVSNNQAFE
jgi:2-amino-4-hydroxy-6-hydroxymethyldihydropteridine diphosphokinase